MRSSSNTGPLAAFCLMALIWGYNWVVMKVAMSYSGPLEFSAHGTAHAAGECCLSDVRAFALRMVSRLSAAR